MRRLWLIILLLFAAPAFAQSSPLAPPDRQVNLTGQNLTITGKFNVAAELSITLGNSDVQMFGHRILGLGAPASIGDALSEGHAIGAVSPAAGNFTTLNSTGSALNGSIGFNTRASGNFSSLNSVSGSVNTTIGAITPERGTFTAITGSANGVSNVMAFGAKGDGVTDDTAAFAAAVAALGSTGGKVFVPSSPTAYMLASELTVPRNVIVECAGPDSVQLRSTATTKPAIVWADAGSRSAYHRGGMNNCTLSGPGSSTSTIGIYVGGDPASTISASTDYGDFLTFYNDKVQNFGTGYQVGDNSWENRFYSVLFTNNTTGVNIPANITNSGENTAFFGGAIQNGTTGVVNNNPNADLVFNAMSFDGLSSSVAVAGTSASTIGGGIAFTDSHVEYFDSTVHPLRAPLFAVYGNSPFSYIRWTGGVIQFDNVTTAPTVEAIAKVTGAVNTATFTLDGTRISSNVDNIIFSGTCAYTGPDVCIEGSVAAAVSNSRVGMYWYWNNAHQGVVNHSHANLLTRTWRAGGRTVGRRSDSDSRSPDN